MPDGERICLPMLASGVGGHHADLRILGPVLIVGLHGIRNHYSKIGPCTPRVAFVLPAWNEAEVLGSSIDALGAPWWIRTTGLKIRSLVLYPAELRARVGLPISPLCHSGNSRYAHIYGSIAYPH